MSDTYGPMYAQPLMRFDPTTQSWRTCLDTSLWDLPMSLVTLPASGLMRNGVLFERPMLERPATATDSSSLPTPRAAMHKNQAIAANRTLPSSNSGKEGVQLTVTRAIAARIAILPTPISQNARGQNGYDRGLGTFDDQNLAAIANRIAMLPTPTTQETHSGPSQRNRNTVPLNERVKDFFPTPTVMDMGNNKTPEEWTAWKDEQRAKHNNGNGHGESLTQAAIAWGKYEPAIRRWENLTREVPEPTVPHKDRRRLNPAFVEWMMGLPAGHVTGHGLSAAKELKMLGNGVVPQQAAAAIGALLQRGFCSEVK